MDVCNSITIFLPLIFPFRTNSVQTLIFPFPHAILTYVAQSTKTKVYRACIRFPREREDRKAIHWKPFLPAKARVFETFHT